MTTQHFDANDPLRKFRERFHIPKVADGNDYPFPLGESAPGKLIESMPYEESIVEMLMPSSALNWLSREAVDFVPN